MKLILAGSQFMLKINHVLPSFISNTSMSKTENATFFNLVFLSTLPLTIPLRLGSKTLSELYYFFPFEILPSICIGKNLLFSSFFTQLLVSAKLVLYLNQDLLVIFSLIYFAKYVYANFVSVTYSYQQTSKYCKRCQNISTDVYLPFTTDTRSSSLLECLSKYQVTYTHLQYNYK